MRFPRRAKTFMTLALSRFKCSQAKLADKRYCVVAAGAFSRCSILLPARDMSIKPGDRFKVSIKLKVKGLNSTTDLNDKRAVIVTVAECSESAGVKFGEC